MKTLFFALVIAIFTACGSPDQSSTISETENPALRRGQYNVISKSVSNASQAISSALMVHDPRSGQQVVTGELLKRTKCIIAISVHRGAFLLGGNGGDGLMSCRMFSKEWSAPSFVRTGGFELSAGIGYTSFNLAMFITDEGLANRYKQQANFDVRSYLSAVAANASAAILNADRYGMAVIQTNDAGLYAGVGITFSSLSHMMAVRNPLVYQNVFGQSEPTDRGGRTCASYVIRRRREACIAEWSARTGGSVASITARAILETPANLAPQITKVFNDNLRRL